MQTLRHLLWPFALLYGAGVAVRGWLFDRGILRSEGFKVPVICVGNLETGGTGKSPLVLHICALLAERGHRVALLSRGYGRSGTDFRWVTPESTVGEVGDEPLQARLRLGDGVRVAVCADRVQGIRAILGERPSADVIVLDDAFQHRHVRPSLSILVTPSERPFWRNHLLPVGSLRDLPSAASRADALILMGNGPVNGAMPFAGRVFSASVAGGAPVHFLGEKTTLAEGDGVLLLSGIARPQRFNGMAGKRFNILGHSSFSDHHVFTADELRALRERFLSFGSHAKAILTTEKDAARLRNDPERRMLGDVPVFFLPIALEPDDDLQNLHHFITDHVERDKRNG